MIDMIHLFAKLHLTIYCVAPRDIQTLIREKNMVYVLCSYVHITVCSPIFQVTPSVC